MQKSHLYHTIGMLFFLLTLLLSCSKPRQAAHRQAEADSLINAAYGVRDYQQLLTLADELQSDGSLSPMKACYWRGYAYSRMRQMRAAEITWKEAIALNVNKEEDLEYYAKSANRLAGLLYLKADYESILEVAVPAVTLLKERAYDRNTDYANLQTFIGNCQLKLGKPKEAAKNYVMAYQNFLQLIEDNNDIANYSSTIVGLITITEAYLSSNRYQEACEWTDRFDSMLQRYRRHPQANADFIDKQWARLNFYRSCALEGLGHHADARKAYEEAMLTRYAKSSDGQIEATTYLMSAHRWSEAADNFDVLEEQIRRYDIKVTLDIIQTYLLPKYRANTGAGRKDSAIAVGRWICNALDSAILWEKQDAALELATIYNTQQKEAEIAKEKARMSRQRMRSAIIVMFVVILGFALFIFQRHQAAKRLEKAFGELEIANARAEESLRMKTNFIQQISHEIRTPLNILSGFTQVITTPGMELDEATRNDINRQITENTDRITGLVNKMLELSDASSRSVIACSDNVPAVQIAAEAAEASGITAATHLTFDLQLTPEAENAMLTTNHQAAVRALSLVLDNARKFTAPAEAHRKKGETREEKEHVLLSVSCQQKTADATSKSLVVFAVEDTGIGVPESEAEHIFDEFVQLDQYYDGTGIGLTVARSLARRLGGDLMLDTTYTAHTTDGRESSGARFVLTLPLS